MKHTWLYLMMWCAAFMSMGCLSVSEQPQFTAIAGNDLKPIKLLHRALQEHNTVELYFSGTTALTVAEAVLVRTNQAVACTVESLAVSDAVLDELTEANGTISAFSITPSVPIEIGEKFIVRGSVTDSEHRVLDFALPFAGKNDRPACLQISEIRPLYSSKPKSEFIECIVMKPGNLAGITILNVGDKNQPHYTFPAAEVKKGEVVVYHWRSVEANIRDELAPSIISKGTQASAGARDFWGPFTSLPKRNANVVLIKTHAKGPIQDAVLYCTKKEFDKRSPALSWGSEQLAQDAIAAVASGAWSGSAKLKDSVITALAASKSLVRKSKTKANNAGNWLLRPAKAVTMGKAY
ncbi:MAG: hypothetical protein ACTTI3_04415 [Treponema sp.]